MRARLRRFKGGQRFRDPRSLFMGNAQGFWLDFTDMSTMFQDSAGTIPVTALGDPVGLVRDKSGNGYDTSITTATARPTFGRMPRGGARNRFTRTQEFSNAAWVKTFTTATDNQATAPNGTVTGALVAEQATLNNHFVACSGSFVSGRTYTVSIYVRKGPGGTAPNIVQLTLPSAAFGLSQYANFNILTGQVLTTSGGTAAIEDAGIFGGQWWRISWAAAATATATGNAGLIFTNNNDSLGRVPVYTGATTSDVYVWGGQLELGSVATDYQKVVQAYDVTEAGVDSVPCLWFDGTDDHLAFSGSALGMVRNASSFSVTSAALFTKALATVQNEFYATMGASSASRANVGGSTSGAGTINFVQARRLAGESYNTNLTSSADTFTGYVKTADLRYSTGYGALRVNGSVTSSNASYFSAGLTEDSDSQNVFVGRISTNYFGGFLVGQAAVKNTLLTANQLASLENYFMNQMGIAA